MMTTETTVIDAEPTQALAVRQELGAEALIARAIDKNLNVESLERLMVLRQQWKAEQAKEAFDRDMAAFQAECPTIEKTKKVYVKSQLRYSYAPLEVIVKQVKDLLRRYGFSYTLDAAVEPGWVTATCKATHTQGHSQTSQFKVPIQADAFMSEPQKFASALTFAKRYAFCNAFGILTGDEDDDSQSTGNGNGHKEPAPVLRPEPKPEPPKPAPMTGKQMNDFLERCKVRLLSRVAEKTLEAELVDFGTNHMWFLTPDEGLDAVPASKMFPNVKDGMNMPTAEAAAKADYLAIIQSIEPMGQPGTTPAPANPPPPEDKALVEFAAMVPEQPKAMLVPEGATVIESTVIKVTSKSGENNGKKWTRYGGQTVDGTWYNTFSDTVGQKLTDAKMSGKPVKLVFKAGAKGNDLLDVQ